MVSSPRKLARVLRDVYQHSMKYNEVPDVLGTLPEIAAHLDDLSEALRLLRETQKSVTHAVECGVHECSLRKFATRRNALLAKYQED